MSNPMSNPERPPEDLRQRMRDEHGIGWHPKGGWCRKFTGDKSRTYFGKCDPPEAIRRMHREEHRRSTGAPDESKMAALAVKDAVDLFLLHLDRQLADHKIGPAQRASYGDEIDRFIKQVGKNRSLLDFTKITAADAIFRPLRETAVARGMHAAEKHINQVRAFLDWCSGVRRLMPAPFYADAFDPPSEKEKKAARKAERRLKGQAFWEPAEVREIVVAAKAADVHRYAQVLLMLNGGMGNTDLSYLEDEDVDWKRRCIHTDRSKTLVPRVVPLWDKTIAAMKASRAVRPAPAREEWATRFFLTMHGKPLVIETLRADDKRKIQRTDSIKNWFYQLINGPERGKWTEKVIRLPHLKRHRAGAYTLRSVFTTLSLGHRQDKNLEAIILGQTFDRPILEFYIRDEQREKLRKIVDHVRHQLWPNQR